MHKICILFFIVTLSVKGQDTIAGSNLKEVVITSYFEPAEQFYQPVSSVVIDNLKLQNSRDNSLLNLSNQYAGIHMEERSPGSFRFSIRGSLLRSPFGIRNVKFYFNDFAITDAGGNTYLNLFDHSMFTGIEILKGPDGSIFGSNSGGVARLLIVPPTDTTLISVRLSSGSFGEVYQSLKVNRIYRKHQLTVFESFRRNDGYRRNSSLNRTNIFLSDKIILNDKVTFEANLFLANLYYETPGGLTKIQSESDPRQSRPATFTLPSAFDQKASITNKTGWLGIQMNYKINQQVSFMINAGEMITDFKNPFITNYETRKEQNTNSRLWFLIENKNFHMFRYKLVVGTEASMMSSRISNSENEKGVAGEETSSDKIDNRYLVLFSSLSLYAGKKIILQASVSNNMNSTLIKNTYPNFSTQEINYKDQLMPRIAFSYSPAGYIVIHGVISKGYSVPTTAEIRPSGNIINTSLQPESGWNREAGIRLKSLNKFFSTEFTYFDYALTNTISRRTSENDTEYFLNSGRTSQKGIEIQTTIDLPVSKKKSMHLIFGNAITLNDFRFVDYISGETDLSGKKLTGIPDQSYSTSLELKRNSDWSLSATYYYNQEIPLNDLSDDLSPATNLINLKAEKYFIMMKSHWTVFLQVENLTNEIYSAGYDLNALGGRYYNPSPARNFMAGICLKY